MTESTEQSPPLAAPAQTPDADTIERWLTAQVAMRLKLDPKTIHAEQDLLSHGVDSLMSVTLVCDLEQWLDRKLEDTLIFDYPTIGQLARHLADARES